MPGSIHAGDVLAGRYEVDDLLAESEGGRFWSARDLVLARQVAVHLIGADDPRAPLLFEAARRSARTGDRRILRVLDADQHAHLAFVVNEWGQGISLDLLLADNGPLTPRQAAWLVDEVADILVATHETGVPHGRLVPENVLIDHNGHVRLIGFAVDAALHGVAAPSLSDDVTNLGALLYAALTGKWPGLGESDVPSAPVEHGKVLRPRRVRAGIPRPLDELCDALLNHAHHWAAGIRHRPSYDTVAQVGAELHEFVGDGARFRLITGGASAAPQLIALPPEPHQPVGSHRAHAPDEGFTPDPVLLDEGRGAADAGDADDRTTRLSTGSAAAGSGAFTESRASLEAPLVPDAPPVLSDLPTEAGIPVFEEGGDVGWIAARSTPPPPPPEHEPRAVKPLFAPEPPGGGPARRPRRVDASSEAEYWPWGEATGTTQPRFVDPALTDSSATWGSALVEDSYSFEAGFDHSGDLLTDSQAHRRPPGRTMLRVAMVIGAVTLLVLVAAGLKHLFLDADPTETPPRVGASAPAASAAKPELLTPVTVTDFDPQGDPDTENPELVPLAIDGDPATAWRTSSYAQNFGPTGLKLGLGLVFDLGELKTVRTVEVSVVGETAIRVFVTPEPLPADGPAVAALEPSATASGDGTLRLKTGTAAAWAEGRYVTVWLTSLPQDADGYRGQIAEVAIRGR